MAPLSTGSVRPPTLDRVVLVALKSCKCHDPAGQKMARRRPSPRCQAEVHGSGRPGLEAARCAGFPHAAELAGSQLDARPDAVPVGLPAPSRTDIQRRERWTGSSKCAGAGHGPPRRHPDLHPRQVGQESAAPSPASAIHSPRRAPRSCRLLHFAKKKQGGLPGLRYHRGRRVSPISGHREESAGSKCGAAGLASCSR